MTNQELFTGNLIDSLISSVETAEHQNHPSTDNMIFDRLLDRPLTPEEVLVRSGIIGTFNPYEALVRSVGRWM